MDSITGRTAFVSGSSQGLGRVIAQVLAAEGCRVVINYANHADRAESVAREIAESGGNAVVERCDVSDEGAVNALFERYARESGGIDILVNNARIDPWLRTGNYSEGEWFDKVMAINLRGAFLCCKAFFDNVKGKGWGRIVNISSSRAFMPAEPHMIAYGMSKAGMHALTRAYAQNGAAFGITANSVAPGTIETENLRKRLNEKQMNDALSIIPLKRGGTCEEIADAVLFVLKNGYVTGETVNINGGLYYAP